MPFRSSKFGLRTSLSDYFLSGKSKTQHSQNVTRVSATGGTILTPGNGYRYHIFTGPGSFVVSKAPSAPTGVVDYLVVAGGGQGGGPRGGGGGGGGFRLSNSLGLPAPLSSPLANPAGITVTAQSYPITVGGGGTGGGPGPSGGNGNPAVFSTITSAAGGGGGSDGPVGGSGGSGGGGGESSVNSCKGTGNTPPVNPSQGNPGGYGTACGPHPATGAPYAGGGGGGAGARGNNACGAENFRFGGVGGIGSFIDNSFVGPTAPSYGTSGPVANTRYFTGGGGGSSCNVGNPGATVPGGDGGGGPASASTAGVGATNTGGGGGVKGHQPGTGGNGGSGIVMIRYKYK